MKYKNLSEYAMGGPAPKKQADAGGAAAGANASPSKANESAAKGAEANE